MTTDATLLDPDGTPTLRFERQLGAPVERVWHAVTDEREMRAWFPSAVVGERTVGAPLSFPFDDTVADTFEGEVTEWEPMRAFGFTWNGDHLRVELEPDGGGTRLVFTQRLQHLTEAARTASGWDMCLDGLLAHLGGAAVSPDAWRGRYLRYLDRMGPPLATPSEELAWTWERVHHVAPERVWQCLTDPAELEAWMGAPATVDLRVGGTIQHHFPGETITCVVLACDEPTRLMYTFGDHTVVEWRLERTEHGSRFWLTQHALERATAFGKGAGWHAFLLSLDMYMASGQLIEVEHEAFLEQYAALLG